MTKQADFTPTIIYQTNDLNIIKGMIREQVGIGFLTEIALQESDDLITLSIEDYPQPTFMISLVQPKKPVTNTAHQKIIDVLRSYPY